MIRLSSCPPWRQLDRSGLAGDHDGRAVVTPLTGTRSVFRKLATQKESKIEEGHLMPDHVHMMISIPPKYAVSQVVGFIKGKSAIHLARVYGERKRNFVGQHFWARGYFVSTVGRDEAVIREYIRKQEQEDARLDQLNMWR
jgi:putative transposase